MKLNGGGNKARNWGRAHGEGNCNCKGSEAGIRCVYWQQIEVVGEEVGKVGCEISTIQCK